MKSEIKKLMRDLIIYLCLALGCIIGADYLPRIWHDVALISGGLMLGGVSAIATMIEVAYKASHMAEDNK